MLVPKIEDYFANVKPGEFNDDELDELARSYVPQGEEIDEY